MRGGLMSFKYKYLGILSLGLVFLVGCSHKELRIILDQQVSSPKYRPIIGSGNNDARTIIDYGVVLKIWVSPYKDMDGTLIAAHYEYVWVDRPDFVPGSAVPQVSSGGGVITPTGRLPFSISPSEIDRSNIKSDEVINKFNIQDSQNTNRRIMERVNKAKKAIPSPKAPKKEAKTKKTNPVQKTNPTKKQKEKK